MYSQGNIFSILVFFLWIPIALWGARRGPPARAAALLLLLPVLFLPERVSFNLPGLPEFEKERIAIFWLFVGVLLFHRDRLRSVRLSNWIKLAMVALLGGHVITVLLNFDPLSYGGRYILPHKPYDAVNTLISNALDYILPFVLGAAMFNSAKDLRVFFRVLVGTALVYSLFQLIEIRLSPQLHRWVYGFFQDDFAQTIRGGGFRPTVFMQHGLAVAMFTVAGVLGAAALCKTKIKVFRIGGGWALGYLWLVLFLSKSVAAFLYTLVAMPLVLLARPKTQFRVAAILALIVLLYPDVRAAGLVPVNDINDWANSHYGEDRAGSIMTRFLSEEMLLERAAERPFFGWGTYGRAMVYDPEHGGRPLAIRDGDWIITWGDFGRVGFLGKYLLLLLPVFLTMRQLKRVRRESDGRLLAALAAIVVFSVFDLLPNGNYNYLVFVFSGVLMGCSEGILREQARRRRVRRQAKVQPAPSDMLTEPMTHPV